MENKLIMKRCNKCGAVVEIIKDCTCKDCDIQCCGSSMETITPNSTDAAVEKHLPVYEVIGNYVVVTVPHVMEAEHYIEFVGLSSDKINAKKYFAAGDTAKAVFPFIKGSTLYSYCNKHGLWQTSVK